MTTLISDLRFLLHGTSTWIQPPSHMHTQNNSETCEHVSISGAKLCLYGGGGEGKLPGEMNSIPGTNSSSPKEVPK